MQIQKNGALEYITAGNLSVPHGFTTRLGGVSQGSQAGLNLAIGRGDSLENVQKNLDILGHALGFAPQNLVMTRQTHSDIIRVVTRADHQGPCHKDYPECDGLVTNDPGTALLIFTADCTPILLWDPVTGAVGACHAGWRGTVQDIAGKTVKAMEDAFGCDPKNIRAAIGPNIGPCHFETDADVPEAVLAAFGAEAENFIQKRGAKSHIDLKAVNALALRRAGVENVEVSEDCTYCQPGRFWSHRYTRGDRGSQGAIILCREGAK